MSASSDLDAFRRVKPLAFDIAADIHPERWDALGVPAAAAARLAKCRRSRAALSTDLSWLSAGESPLSAVVGWSPSGSGALALLPGEKLWRIGLRLGAARFRGEIAGLVWRDDVAAFKSGVGEDAYRFAMRQAPVLWRNAVLEDEEASAGKLVGRVTRTAALALACWLSELPPAVGVRARLKLPPAVDGELGPVGGWDAGRRNRWLAPLEKVARVA